MFGKGRQSCYGWTGVPVYHPFSFKLHPELEVHGGRTEKVMDDQWRQVVEGTTSGERGVREG